MRGQRHLPGSGARALLARSRRSRGAPAAVVEPRGPSAATIDRIEVSAYRIPTDAPEADGTLSWDSTTMVLVRAWAGGERGLGFSYTDGSAAALIEGNRALHVAQVLHMALREGSGGPRRDCPERGCLRLDA